MTTAEQLAQLREEFEQWAELETEQPWGYLKKKRTASGNYSVQIYSYMWTAYQAAYDALLDELERKDKRIAELEAREIALPKPLKVLLSRSGESINAWPAYTVDSAIRAAGINLTVEG